MPRDPACRLTAAAAEPLVAGAGEILHPAGLEEVVDVPANNLSVMLRQ